MQRCPICKSFNTHVIHHYYDSDLHKTHKVHKCRVCGTEWQQ